MIKILTELYNLGLDADGELVVKEDSDKVDMNGKIEEKEELKTAEAIPTV